MSTRQVLRCPWKRQRALASMDRTHVSWAVSLFICFNSKDLWFVSCFLVVVGGGEIKILDNSESNETELWSATFGWQWKIRDLPRSGRAFDHMWPRKSPRKRWSPLVDDKHCWSSNNAMWNILGVLQKANIWNCCNLYINLIHENKHAVIETICI